MRHVFSLIIDFLTQFLRKTKPPITSDLAPEVSGEIASNAPPDAIGAPPASVSITDDVLVPFIGPIKEIPVKKNITKVYGDPKLEMDGKNIHWDSGWESKNLKTHRDMPGYEGKPVRIHNLVEPYLREALRRAKILCPEYKIKTLGCFSPRFVRHDPKRGVSVHTWAVAVDINATDNRGIDFDGKGPKPFSKEYWETWPSGMPEKFVSAFKSVGFRWGGDWKSYSDNMHMTMVIE